MQNQVIAQKLIQKNSGFCLSFCCLFLIAAVLSVSRKYPLSGYCLASLVWQKRIMLTRENTHAYEYHSALIRNLIMLKGTATLTAQDEWIDHVIPGIDKGHHCTKFY